MKKHKNEVWSETTTCMILQMRQMLIFFHIYFSICLHKKKI